MTKQVRFASVLLAAICFALPALAQNSGEAIYKQRCAMCHGPDGLAGTPTAKMMKVESFKAPSIVKESDAELIATAKKGKGKMPEFGTKLNDSQIREVIAYVRTLQKK